MRKLLVLALTPFVLAGCLGGKNAPDATLVADAPSLVVPPNFELRPPRVDGNGNIVAPAVAPASEQVKQDAQNILVGGEVKQKAPSAPAQDAWLVKEAGGDARNLSIRELMQRETSQEEFAKEEMQSKGWFSRTFGKQGDLEPVENADVESSEVKY